MKPLNGSQFSQIPLFNMKPTDEHRYPRGYTPERRDAVSKALGGPWEVDVHHHSGPGGGSKKSDYVASSNFFAPKPEMGEHQGKWSRDNADVRKEQSKAAFRNITDVVARSSIPLSDLNPAPVFTVGKLNDASGQYARPQPMMKRRDRNGKMGDDVQGSERGRIFLNPQTGSRAFRDNALIHELGHHADFQADPVAFKQRQGEGHVYDYTSPSLEGHAEGYAFGHSAQRRSSPSDPKEHLTYQQHHNDKRFKDRFAAASGGTSIDDAKGLSKVQFPSTARQSRLFERHAPSWATDAAPDYGQFPLVHGGTSEPIDTIKVGRGVAKKWSYED